MMDAQNNTLPDGKNLAIDNHGANNGQMAIGGTIIQFGSVNGGTVNLQPAGSPPAAGDSETHLPAAERAELVTLRRLLNSLFDQEELRDLVFDLAIEYDDLPGAAKKDKARELVAFCRRHGRLAELKGAIHQRRPGVL